MHLQMWILHPHVDPSISDGEKVRIHTLPLLTITKQLSLLELIHSQKIYISTICNVILMSEYCKEWLLSVTCLVRRTPVIGRGRGGVFTLIGV